MRKWNRMLLPALCAALLASCGGNEAALTCNEPSDCPGQICCLVLAPNDSFDGSSCAGNCTGNDLTLCSDSGDCGGNDCQQNADLPDGYLVRTAEPGQLRVDRRAGRDSSRATDEIGCRWRSLTSKVGRGRKRSREATPWPT